MKLVRNAVAGTLESSDVLVSIQPADRLEVEVDSVVMAQWGRAIRETVNTVLQAAGVTTGLVRIQDRGARDCTLRARLTTVLDRASRAE